MTDTRTDFLEGVVARPACAENQRRLGDAPIGGPFSHKEGRSGAPAWL
jgi:hypothetical protein